MRSILSISALLVLSTACRDVGDVSIGAVSNLEPAVVISEPGDGSEYNFGDQIDFTGLVADDTGVDLLIASWISSIDGVLIADDDIDVDGNVMYSIANLTEGPHVITLRAQDSEAAFGEANVNVIVVRAPEDPEITIIHPTAGEMGGEDAPYRFEVSVRDHQNDARDLLVVMEEQFSDGSLMFACSMPVDIAGTAWCDASFAYGPHTFQFTVTDLDGNIKAATASIVMVSLDELDNDGDGFCEADTCADGTTPGDCDDTQITVCPTCTEICDTLDNDCNPVTPIDVGTECYDDDGDGFCEFAPCTDGTTGGDCDDVPGGIGGIPGVQIYPGKPEIMNYVDDDCNNLVDDTTVRYDDDFDGYCESPILTGGCQNTTNTQVDCDDTTAAVGPLADERCDGIDNNCDGLVDPAGSTGAVPLYQDKDNDSYGFGSSQMHCLGSVTAGDYKVTNNNDCYDNNASAYPGAGGWFTSNRGDGSFDYNCNGASEKRYGSTGIACVGSSTLSCSSGTPGWSGSVPSCGGQGNYMNGCDSDFDFFCLLCLASNDWASCLVNSCSTACTAEYQSNRNQECH